MPYQTVAEGRQLFYRFDGPEDAPVVMFSNSLGTDLGLWEAQVSALNSRFRVLRYDTRGHGKSEAPPGEYKMEDLAADVPALLDRLEIEKVRFCGLSMGGAIGQILGATAPGRIERLVLANTGATFGSPDIWSERMRLVAEGGMAAVVEAVLGRWFTAGFREREAAAVDRVRSMLLGTPAQGYIGCSAALRDTNLVPLLASIQAPTLVIGGTHDGATPPASAEELATHIRRARLVMLEASHLSAIEQAEAFTEALTGFLE